MRIVNTHSTLFVTALAVAAFALQAQTAEAGAKRDAIIQQCIAKAQAEGGPVIPGTSGDRRVEIYKACMVAAGQRP
jgi:hypothetical protein